MLDDCSIIIGSMNEDDETSHMLEVVDPDGNVLTAMDIDSDRFIQELFDLVGVDVNKVNKPFNMWIHFAGHVNGVEVE